MNFIIYGLYSTDENIVRYIGLTKQSISKRVKDHIYEALHPHLSASPDSLKNNWIRSCINRQALIKYTILEEANETGCDEREKYWISYFGRNTLVNGTDGGRNAFFSFKRNKKKEKIIG